MTTNVERLKQQFRENITKAGLTGKPVESVESGDSILIICIDLLV